MKNFSRNRRLFAPLVVLLLIDSAGGAFAIEQYGFDSWIEGWAPTTNPSMQVLDALARALGLDEAERAHLQRLASVNDTKGKVRSGRTRLRPDLVTLLDAMPDVAAVALSPLQDIIAWMESGNR